MNTRKLVKYAVFYSVGIYAFQRFTGKQLGLPAILDPLGLVLGYPLAPSAPAIAAATTTGVPAVITAAAPMTTS